MKVSPNRLLFSSIPVGTGRHPPTLPPPPVASQGLRISTGFYNNQSVEQYASFQTRKITIRQLIAFGRNMTDYKLLKSANYVRRELAVRIAHRIRDFQRLPFIVGTNPRVELAYGLYCGAFDMLRKFKEIDSISQNEEFCQTLRHLLKSHLVVIPNLVVGMVECREYLAPADIDLFMNDVLRTRIGRRVLAEQHIMLSEQFSHGLWNNGIGGGSKIGIIDTKCNAHDVVLKCSALARAAVAKDAQLDVGVVPEIRVGGHTNATFTYIPDHIEYILFELLKNSLRSQLKMHGSKAEAVDVLICASPAPPIQNNDSPFPSHVVTFRISDKGGGFAKSMIPPAEPFRIWSFSHLCNNFSDIEDEVNGFEVAGKLSDSLESSDKLGIGLQLARVFANYWGGDIDICTMYGYGSDVYVKINTAGTGTERLTLDRAEVEDYVFESDTAQ